MYIRAVSELFVRWLFRSAFFSAVGWDFDDDAFRLYGGAARLRWFLTVFVDLF